MRSLQRQKGKIIILVTSVMVLLMFHVWLPQSAEPSFLGMPLHFYYMVAYGLLSVGSTALIFELVWPREDPDFDNKPNETRSEEKTQ